ncbi:hypothetical protein ECG_06328 [Echinococcus granulosus]|nr:hypothetical protein ECG_06328 [Echinococcus granulosus]
MPSFHCVNVLRLIVEIEWYAFFRLQVRQEALHDWRTLQSASFLIPTSASQPCGRVTPASSTSVHLCPRCIGAHVHSDRGGGDTIWTW